MNITDILNLLINSAHEVERAKPADERLKTENWTSPGEEWFESFLKTVESHLNDG